MPSLMYTLGAHKFIAETSGLVFLAEGNYTWRLISLDTTPYSIVSTCLPYGRYHRECVATALDQWFVNCRNYPGGGSTVCHCLLEQNP